MLLQAELLTAWSRVVGIEDAGDILGGLTLSDSPKVITRIERVKVEFLARPTPPQAQVVGVIGVIARYRSVVCLGHDCLPVYPVGSLDAMLIILIYATIEANWVHDI